MGLLTDEMRNFINYQKLGYVATVCPDNSPNLSPKGTIMVLDDTHLVFADIKSPNTIANLEKNPSVEINVVDPISRKGYRFKGFATIISSGNEYDSILKQYSKNGIKSKINKIVRIKVEKVSEVTSPLYDLGFAEDDIKKRWKEHYLSS